MLKHILKDDPVYRQLKDGIEDYRGPILVSGCTDTAKWHLTSLIGNKKKKQFKIIIVPDENKARQWVEASHFFGEKAQYIPAKDPLFYTADVHGNAIARDRMLAIKKILDDKCGIFVMTIDAVMDQVVPLSDIKNHKMTFKTGETLEEAAIAEEFVARGYEKAPFVEAPGEFAVRGGIIDIFPYTQESPYRIELWGDEIDSIRSFDKESQRSIEEVETLTIYPASRSTCESSAFIFSTFLSNRVILSCNSLLCFCLNTLEHTDSSISRLPRSCSTAKISLFQRFNSASSSIITGYLDSNNGSFGFLGSCTFSQISTACSGSSTNTGTSFSTTFS